MEEKDWVCLGGDEGGESGREEEEDKGNVIGLYFGGDVDPLRSNEGNS